MGKLRKPFVILFILALLLPVAAGAQDQPTTLRVGTTYIMDTINPANGFYGYNIRPLWQDTLVEWAGGQNFEPGLAENWNVSDDGLVWQFKIREGVTYSDGAPLTANEVAWSLNWVIDNEIPSMISYLSNIETVEALDPTTLQMTLGAPVPDMISAKLLFVWIVAPQVWENISGDDITTYSEYDAVLGSGPYMLTDFQEGEYMIMDANPNYWGGKPPVDRIIYQEYANDDAMIQALLAGEIDLITSVPFSGTQPLLDAADSVTVSVSDHFSLEELIINSSPDGTQPASLNDPIVRSAISHAIDKQQIITVAYLGYATPAATFLGPAYGDFHNTDIQDDAFDLAEANRLLDEAGYMDTNGDGVREYSDGSLLEYRLYAPESSTYYARVIEIISNDLAQIGISAPPQVLSDDSLIALQPDYDNDLIYWGWNFDPDPAFAVSIFTCDETVDGGWSDSGYCNPDYDALYEAQSTAVDHEQRREAIWQAQQMIFDDKPYIPVAYYNSISAYRSSGFSFDSNLAAEPIKWALFHGFSMK